MDDLTVIGNQIEAIMWFLFAAGFAWKALRLADKRRRLAWMFAVAFLVFGVSDLVEAHTGAWWRPLWLLALKSVCIAVFVYGFWQFLGFRKAQCPSEGP